MTESLFPTSLSWTRDLDRRPRPDNHRMGIPARSRAPEHAPARGPASSDLDVEHAPTSGAVDLQQLQEQLALKPLDEIASLVRGLTYGDMIELCETIWKAQPEASPVTLENLPALLHRWSKSRFVKSGTTTEPGFNTPIPRAASLAEALASVPRSTERLESL
jgi:hypothetical protein